MYMKFAPTINHWMIFLTNAIEEVDKFHFLWYNEENIFGGTDYEQRFRIWFERRSL